MVRRGALPVKEGVGPSSPSIAFPSTIAKMGAPMTDRKAEEERR
jgi:hypothetical protein